MEGNKEIKIMSTEELKKAEQEENGKKKKKKQRTKWKDLPVEVRKKKRRKYIVIGIAVIAVCVFVITKTASSNVKMPVNVVTAVIGDVEATISTSGTVESDVIKTYYAQISGDIGAIPVKQGQAVKAGDVLLHFANESITIASREAEAAALSSSSAYNAAINQDSKTQAELTEATVNLEVLKQQITDYKAFIKEQERRLEDTRNAKKESLSAWGMALSKEQAAGGDVADEMAEYQYDVETLEMSEDLIEIQRIIDDAKEILSNLEEYEAEMKSQKSATEDNVMTEAEREAKEITNDAEQLKNSQTISYVSMLADGLKADMDGIVTEMNVTEGASVTEGAALVKVASSSQVHVTVNLSKTDLAKVKEGQKADVTIAGRKYEGEVSFINHVAKTNTNNMPVVEAQIAITNADEDIYLGIEAKVVIYAQKSEGVLLVPVEAVNSDKDGDFVYIVENGIVVRREVVTGVSSDTYIEVVSGLKEKEQVMTDISLDITEGMEVTIMTDVSDDADATAEEADTAAENNTEADEATTEAAEEETSVESE